MMKQECGKYFTWSFFSSRFISIIALSLSLMFCMRIQHQFVSRCA